MLERRQKMVNDLENAMTMRLALGLACAGFLAQAGSSDAATFYFIRHAESTANSGEASTPEETLDPPLTVLGQQQTLTLAQKLADIDLTHIYVSGYQRTALTIAPTAEQHGLTPVVIPEIGEWQFDPAQSTGDLYTQIAEMIKAWGGRATLRPMFRVRNRWTI